MALSSWLASIKRDVTAVTPVQAPIHAGLRCNGFGAVDVTSVANLAGGAAVATSVTAAGSQTLQLKPAWALGCTPVTAVTAERFNTEGNADNEQLPGELPAAKRVHPKRLFRKPGPWLTGAGLAAARAYHAHHFNCPYCIAAGRGTRYGSRCAKGQALLNAYLWS